MALPVLPSEVSDRDLRIQQALVQLEHINARLEAELETLRTQNRALEEAFLRGRTGLTYRMTKKLLERALGLPPEATAAPSSDFALDWIPEEIKRGVRRNLELCRELGREHQVPHQLESRQHGGVDYVADLIVNHALWGDLRSKKDSFFRGVGLVREQRQRQRQRALPGPTLRQQLDDLLAQLVSERSRHLVPALIDRTERPKIALSLAGGLGDGIWLTAVANALRSKYPDADLYIFTNNTLYPEIFARNRSVRASVVIDGRYYHFFDRLMAPLLERGSFDAWYECKYTTKVHYSPYTRISKADQDETAAAFARYQMNFNPFPLANNGLSLAAAAADIDLLGLVGRSTALDLSRPRMTIVPADDDVALLDLVSGIGDYITIHHGCDPKLRISHQEPRQTKNWTRDRWEEVVAHIKATTQLQIVQLGTADEDRLSGVDHCLLGRTNVGETALVLKHSRLHLDTEGGLVHVARAVGTRSLVLFGPTSIEFFGYSDNLNLQVGACHTCWWSTTDWYRRCPRGLETPECLDAITPAHVMAAIDPLLAAAPLQARYRLEDASLFDQQLLVDRHAELVALRVYNTTRAEVADNWQYLYALSQTEKQLSASGTALKVLVVARDRSELPLAFARRGYEPRLCLLDAAADAPVDVAAENGFLRALRDRVEVSFGGATNMPYASDSFDVVVATAIPFHAAAGKRALEELLRVARPNGVVVLPVTIAVDHTSGREAPSHFSERALEELVASIGLSYLSRSHDLLQAARALRGELDPIEPETTAVRRLRSTVGGLSIRKLPAQPRPAQRPERRTHHFIDGVELTMCDYADSFALHAIIDELRSDCYRIKDIPFAPGDVVFDVGAHVGTFSLLLAKKYPFLQIVAFEPFPDNYRHFLENIRLNGVSNIVVYNKAVSGDGRGLSMKFPRDNTGSASIEPVRPGESNVVQAEVESVTLEEMLRRHVPGRCKLLKMDCEGAEFEVLPATPSLDKVDYLSAEFHMSDRLKSQGHSMAELVQLCRRMIPAEHVTVVGVEIA